MLAIARTRRRRRSPVAVAIGATVLLCAACSGGGGGSPQASGGGGGAGGGGGGGGTALSIVSIAPADGAAAVERTVLPRLRFSHALDAATIDAASVVLHGAAGDVAITASVQGDELGIAPAARLEPNATYDVRIATTVRGAGGEVLAAPFAATFTVADRAWRSGAELLETDDHVAQDVDVATTDDGAALAVWMQYDDTRTNLVANRRDPRTGWGTATLLETDDAGAAGASLNGPSVAMDAAGNGVAAWSQFDGTRWNLVANRHDHATGWGTAQLLENENLGGSIGARNPHVRCDAAGRAWVVWSQPNAASTPSIRLQRFTPGNGWLATPEIVSTAAGQAAAPQVGVDAQGNVLVVWRQRAANGRWDVWSRRRDGVSGAWNAAAGIESDDADPSGARDPRLVVAANGEAVATWSHFDGVRDNVRANRFVPGSGWGASVLVESADQPLSGAPDVAIDANGRAVVVFVQLLQGWSVQATHSEPGSSVWGAPVTVVLPSAGITLKDVRLAANGAGRAHAVWTRAASAPAAETIESARCVIGGAWSAPHRLDSRDGSNAAALPRIAVDVSGDAIAVFTQHDGTRPNVHANRFE